MAGRRRVDDDEVVRGGRPGGREERLGHGEERAQLVEAPRREIQEVARHRAVERDVEARPSPDRVEQRVDGGAIALPAALVFRSRYRAYSGARWLLVAAFLVTLPSFGHAVAQLLLHDPNLGDLGALLVILAVLSSLTGFMGAETTGAGSFLAVAVVLAFTADLVVGRLAVRGDEPGDQ